MPAVQGWTEADLAAREQVFEALVAKSVHMSLRPLTLNLGSIITAASIPSISNVPTNPQPVLALAETGVVTATWETYVAKELYPFVTQTFVDSAAATLGGMETALDVSIPKVTDSYARDFLSAAFNRLMGIGDLIWSLIRDQLTDGYALGESIHQLAARIRSVAGLTEGRANAVARTEVISAANLGSLAQVQLGGFSDDECEKEWEATDDERTRLAHAAADGQRVPLSQPFSVGGEGLMVPGDPTGRPDNIIQCRCTVLFHFADDAEPDSDDLEPLTAADFDEKKHPRDTEGKFARKLRGVPIPVPASTTVKLFGVTASRKELGDWYGQLTRDRWAKISDADRKRIIAIADEESIDGRHHHLSDVLNALRLGIPRVGLRHVKNMPENVMFERDALELTKWYESLTPLDYRRLVNSDNGASLAGVAERQKTKGNPKPLAKLQELRVAAKAAPTEGLVQDTPAVDAARARVAAPADISVPAVEGVGAHQITAKRAEQIQATLNGGSMTWPAGPQRTALKSYTDSTYRQINDVLRRPEAFGDENDKIRYLERAADVQSAMKPWPEDTVVYRGTGSTQFGLDLDYDQFWRLEELVGKTFVDRGFTSTTISSDQAFDNEIRLEIVVPRGTPAAYVGVVSDHSEENELVLAAGTRFKVISVDVRDQDEERENDYRISEVTSSVEATIRLQVVP